MYIVVLYKANIGCVLDGKEKVFNNLYTAKWYKGKLNIRFAKYKGCAVKDLSDFYVIEGIEVG